MPLRLPRTPSRRRKDKPLPPGYAVGFLIVHEGEIVNACTFTGSDPNILAAMATGRLLRSGIGSGDELSDALAHSLSHIDLDDPDLPDLPDLSFHPDEFHFDEPDNEGIPQVSVCIRAGYTSWTGQRPAVEVVAGQTDMSGPYKTGQPVDLIDEYGDEYVAHVLAPTPGRGRFLAFSERRDLLIDCVAPPEFSRTPSVRLVRNGGRKGREFFIKFASPPSLDTNLHHITTAA